MDAIAFPDLVQRCSLVHFMVQLHLVQWVGAEVQSPLCKGLHCCTTAPA